MSIPLRAKHTNVPTLVKHRFERQGNTDECTFTNTLNPPPPNTHIQKHTNKHT